MAQKSRSALNTQFATDIPDNTSQQISAQDVREAFEDSADSAFNLTSDTLDDVPDGTNNKLLTAENNSWINAIKAGGFFSETDTLPSTTGAVEGTVGGYYPTDRSFQPIELSSGSWVDLGNPISVSPAPPLSEEPVWNPQKSANNPVISGSTVEADQSYPPQSIYDPVNDKYYIVAKSGGKLVLFRSDDGLTNFSQVGIILDTGTSGAFDDSKLESGLIRYDSSTGVYNLIYNGFSTANDDVTIGLATSNDIESLPFTKQGQIYTGADIEAELGQDYNVISITDLVFHDSQYVFYGRIAIDDGNGLRDRKFACFTGTDFNDINFRNVIFSEDDIASIDPETPITLIQDFAVFEHNGAAVAIFTAGINSDVLGERALYSAYGDWYNFTPCYPTVLTAGDSGSWDERRVYAADVLKKSDDEYKQPILLNDELVLYYSGHDLSEVTGNIGLTGIATYSEIPDLSMLGTVKPETALEYRDKRTVTDLAIDNVATLYSDLEGYNVIMVTIETNRPDTAIISFQSTDSNQFGNIVAQSGSNIEIGEGTNPTGTTGNNGVATVHITSTAGLVEIENRLSGARTFTVQRL